jgi:hypothetical protein
VGRAGNVDKGAKKMHKMNPKEMYDAVLLAIDALDKASAEDDYNCYRQQMNEARERMKTMKAAMQRQSNEQAPVHHDVHRRCEKLKGMQSVKDTLKQRAVTHGSFEDHAKCTQALKKAMRVKNWNMLSDQQKEALDMIAHKIGRVLSGDPNHQDHWHDIAGYSTLVESGLNEGGGK